ncbi:MAG TPA: type II secretion system secretin GspD [Bryobacteraceae bacterium]
MMVRIVVPCLLMVTLCAAQREPAPSSGVAKPAPVQAPAAPAPKPAPAAQTPDAAAPKPAPAGTSAAQAPAAGETPKTAPAAAPADSGFVLNLQNASLPQVIEILARRLRINYILDPRVKGSVTLNTYGEIKRVDTRTLLETVLRINGAAMVQVGDIYRIVPVAEAARLPLAPQTDAKNLADDERMTLNLIFLKYATVAELSKLIEPFLGEGARLVSYEPANLLLILDNTRSMKRTMELISVFDNDTLASQRVRLFEVKHGRPSDLSRELEGVMKAVSLTGEKGSSAVRFLPIDRINTIVAIAPNPGVFAQVEAWLTRLDLEPKVTAGTVDNYVYRVKYGWAQMLSMAIMQLYLGYTGYGGYGMGMGGYGMGMMGGYGMGGMGMGGYGMGGMGIGGIGGMGIGGMGIGGLGMGGYGLGGMGMGGYGMGGYGMGGYGMGGYGMGGYGMGGYGMGGYPQPAMPFGQQTAAGSAQPGSSGTADQTGNYLSAGGGYGVPPASRIPRVIPNSLDNTLLIQATPQDYQQILKLLEQLDVAPRQVLIEAKIYEVNMQGAFSAGVQAYLQNQNQALPAALNGSRQLQANTAGATAASLTMTAGLLVGNSRQLLGILSANETNKRAKLVSAPTIIATDSIAASLNVGASVPTLSGTLQSGLTGTGSVATAVQNVQTGVTLNVIARVTPSGIITMKIEQQVSAPVAPDPKASIQTPSFQNRTMSTQVTVQDGDTIAIGGIILDSDTLSSAGIPLLHRIPVIGAAFGTKSLSKERTELVIFFTPRVIYDTNQITDASEEIKSRFKRLRPVIQE